MKKEALDYHEFDKPGKIAIEITKSCASSSELSLAYSPGVAYPCLEIAKNPEDAFRYTSKGNLVGVISNGSAVLGLGNIGALAGKPVMEGKGVLFKRFAGIDVFDIEVDQSDPEKFIEAVASLEPTFGGINLEDIKAPDCFHIEKELIERLNIPVFHDDQHGTAVIVAAALKNALLIAKKEFGNIKIVINGAGSAAIAISHLLLDVGVQLENIHMFDSRGLISKSRTDTNEYKQFFAQNDPEDNSLASVMKNADVFIGVSVGNILSGEMVKTMAEKPIIFALANPTPEISPDDAKAAVPDAIVATGRSDFANQVNNVLGFPFIFRAALDVRATTINKEMKLSAVNALASLAHEEVPASVTEAYGQEFTFGPDYIIPKPFDPRLLYYVTPEIVKTAMATGVAKKNIDDIEKYTNDLKDLSAKLSPKSL
jgi:malate dehydrogenase (oxaloacetate-decarboxylating)(NADP+)